MTNNAYDNTGGRKYLNSNESELFLQATKSLPLEKQALCLTLYYSGCRLSEILNLKSNHIEKEPGIISVLCLKKRKRKVWRRLPLPPLLIQLLLKITPDDGQAIWKMSRTSAWRVVKQTMTDAGIEGTQASPKGLSLSQ